MYSYHFPAAIFAKNTIKDQIDHVESEVIEVRAAFLQPSYVLLAEELWDTVHSAETALRIMEERYGYVLGSSFVPCAIPAAGAFSLSLYFHIKRLTSKAETIQLSYSNSNLLGIMYGLLDLIDTAICALSLIKKLHGLDIDVVKADVIMKNLGRGYYAMTVLAEGNRPAGAHSGFQGAVFPASPSIHPDRENPSNSPEEVADVSY